MKTILNFFVICCISSYIYAQNFSPLSIQCIESSVGDTSNIKNLSANCGNNSPYSNDPNLYLPQLSDDVIYLKLNFIFLTKPDGKGNFEQNNPEHLQALNDIIANMNYRLLNMQQPDSNNCTGYGNNNLPTTKLQLVVNKVWKVDPAWNYLITGYNPNLPGGINNYNNRMLYPDNSDYYYKYLDNDTSIPSGINIVFANNGFLYDEMVNNHNFSLGYGEGWAISMTPTSGDFTQKLRQFFPDSFNAYYIMKNYIADNPNHPQYPNTPWSTAYGWFVHPTSGSILHETGHNLNLGHQNSCQNNIMNQCGICPRNYLSNSEISTIFRSASTSNLRQYFTENSFKNTSILSNSNQIWDLNFRLYSNVKVDNNSTLKATCKIIMAPDSRFIVKNGSNFTMEGAEITSADNTTWNGIKVEGNGSFLILPNTSIETKYFYAYADNTPLPKEKTYINFNESSEKEVLKENSLISDDYKIYPNPTGDYINIDTKNKISRVEVFNIQNKFFSTNFQKNKVDVRKLTQGNYILKILTNSGFKTIHFIKK